MVRNNNHKIIMQLARREYRADKGRRLVLAGAVAFAVMALFSVFSFASGKIETDMLRKARERGAVAHTSLERATQEQYEQIQELSYIKEVGKYVQFGETQGARCVVADQVVWEKIKKPAFTDIHGTYPREKMEIMLPMSALKWMGITAPRIGMELPITVNFPKDSGQEEFQLRLCGYYTEYIAQIIYGPPDAYFSQAFLDSISEGREWDVTLIMRQEAGIDAREVERKLYADIKMRDVRQLFLGENTAIDQAVLTIAGGYGTIALLAGVILLGAGLLSYNVIRISAERKIREQGLLKTLGTTTGQLCAISFWQTAHTVFWGSLLGGVAGTLLVMLALPFLLSNMYLYRMGSAAGMLSFHPLLLAASILFAACITFLSTSLAIRRTVRLSPVEAVSYMEKISPSSHARNPQLWQMAWRNILRFKRRFLVSAFSLTLGITMSLGITMISKGADTTNQIEHDYADISVSTSVSSTEYDGIASNSKRKNEDGTVTLFPEALLEKIQALPGIRDITFIRGGFGEVLMEEDALSILLEKNEWPWWTYRGTFVAQKMSDAYLQELKVFAQEKDLVLDVDAVIRGEGMILMHEHQLSPAQIAMSKEEIGKPFGVYDVTNKKKVRDMRFCGYLDFEQEDLPEFSSTIRFDDNIYFLVSEKGFANLKAREQIFALEITAEPGSRRDLSERIRQLVDTYNAPLAFADEGDYWSRDSELAVWFLSKLDVLEEMKDYIEANRLVMGALCIVLLLMGLVNYINVTITGLVTRKKEFAVMESVGLTRKQLRKMLMLEGVFYSAVITALTGIVGSGIFFLLGALMKRQMPYFVFQYPIWEFAACVAGLFLSCILIVRVLYRKYGEGSIALRLKIYAD